MIDVLTIAASILGGMGGSLLMEVYLQRRATDFISDYEQQGRHRA